MGAWNPVRSLLGLLVGLAVGLYLPTIYRRNVGFQRDERAERIEEKASLWALNFVQITSGAGVAYSAFIAGDTSTAAFSFLLVAFLTATVGRLLLKVYYSRVM
ncbi:DUF2178 domain-containing protein [Thermococcus sp. 9N3]|uniref:DUF2178 domain-containing protein n=1 Tax=Thermococcus sp. 9N3 TaxID=163002 RepID=UPI00143169C0